MMWLVRVMLVAAAAAEILGKCGVTPEWEEERMEEFQRERRLQTVPALSRSSSLGPFRVHAHYLDMSALTNTTLTTRIKEIVMPSVISWLSKVLNVYNLNENWKLSQSTCSSAVTVPAEHKDPGLPNVDLVVYVYAVNEPNKNYIAKGGFCALDGNTFENPLAGTLGYNAAFYSGFSIENEISIARHEVSHILAISSSLFPRYRQPDGTVYANPVVSATMRGNTVTMLTTPIMLGKARAAYNCPSLAGFELENGGGSGTAGSHWEKRIILNDYMVGTVGLDSIYSDITLAAFEDSGWYTVNYDFTDSITFGSGAGCDWFDKKCVIDGVAQFPEFCTTASNSVCNTMYTRKATCNVATMATAPDAAYQYFANSLTAGTDSYADYCPYYEPFGNGDCRGYGPYPTTYNTNFYSEQICDTCMCFIGTYRKSIYVVTGTVHNGCHPVVCEGGVAKVTIGTLQVTCPLAGGQVSGLTGYTGYITCPPYAKLCGPKPCINACLGKGKCVNGACVCQSGYSGADCSIKCAQTCVTCTGAAANQCGSCGLHATLTSGSCVCDSGYGFDVPSLACAPVLTSCDASCVTCTGPSNTQCVSCVSNAAVSATGACVCSSGFTRSSDGTQCVACDPTCAECSGTLSTQCTQCKANAALPAGQTTGACTCNVGFYLKADNTCGACNTTCKECTLDTATSCSSCKPASATVVGGACVCATGFYLTADGSQCLACDITCKNCSSSAATACLSCKPLTATVTNGACVCPATYFLSADGATCSQCDTTCQACSATGSSGCTACYSGGVLTPTAGPGTCGCASGALYSVPTGCQNCHSSCKTCSGTAANQCLACQSGNPNASGECPCPDGTYMNGSGNCVACSGNCRTCNTSPTSCTGCDTSVAQLSGTTCQCLSTAFLNSSSQCVACHATCLTCSAETSTSCTSCVTHATKTAGSCPCDSGYARSADSKTCVACHASCASCSGPLSTNCSNCLSNATLQGTGACACNTGYYMQSDNTCALCNVQCATCNGPSASNCVSCKGTATSVNGVCTCGSHKYLSSDGTQCIECDSSCLTCSGSGASGCISCYSQGTLTPAGGPGTCSCSSGYFYLAGTGCQACNSACRECMGTGSNQCTACASGATLLGPSPNSCSGGGCANGYFFSSSGCAACDITCKTCTDSATKCISCDLAVSTLSGNTCVCNAGLYRSTTGACQPCDATCPTCSTGSSAGCLSCFSHASLSSTPGQCQCATGYFPNTTASLCAACDPSCKECVGASTSMCTACNAPATLSSGSCICAAGYYMDSGTSTCKACAASCLTCSGANDTDCKSCYAQAQLSGSAPSSCVCVSGTSPKPNTANCAAGSCDVTCKSCSGSMANQCTACYTNAVGRGTFPSNCDCASGYFPSPNSANCAACHTSCATCSGYSPYMCLTCPTGKFLISGLYCGDICPSGQTSPSGICTPQSAPIFQVQLSAVSLYANDTVSLSKVQSGSSATLDSNDAVAYYQQGWRFDGSNDYVLLPPNSLETGRNLILDATHSVEMWVRPLAVSGVSCVLSKSGIQAQTLNTRLRLCVTDSYQLLLDIATVNLLDPAVTPIKTIVGGKVASGRSWTVVSYRLLLRSKTTTVTLIINKSTVATAALDSLLFRDASGTVDTVKFVVGAAYATYQTMGNFFNGNIAELTILNAESSVQTSGCTCSLCTSGGLCLSSCLPTEFSVTSGCSACLSTCSNGCIRGTDCRNNVDQLCSSFTTFVGCSACADLAEFSADRICQCVPNSVLVNGACSCAANYKRSYNKCVLCLNYLTPAQVTAYFDSTFLKVVIEFTSAVVSSAAQTCDLLLLPSSIQKLGNGYACAWASNELSVSVLLGMNSTLINEKLELNYVNLYSRQGNCSFTAVPLEPIVTYRYPLPTIAAKLVVPATFSLPCSSYSTLDFDASASTGGKGRPLSFSWTLSSEPYLSTLYTYSSYRTSDPILKVPKSLLSSTLITAKVSVKNAFGIESSAVAYVTVTSGSAISLKVDAGDTLSIRSSTSRSIIAIPTQLCSSTSLSLQFTWSLLESSPAVSATSLPFLSSPSPPNTLNIPSRVLQPGYTYSFAVKASDGLAEGKAYFKVIVTSSPLFALMDRTTSDFSVEGSFVVSGEQSYDPDQAAGELNYLWSCSEGSSECVDTAGSPVVRNEKNPVLSIPQSKLRENRIWNITLTVSKDVRSASVSALIHFVPKAACDFTQKEPTPIRLNAQANVKILYQVTSSQSTTFQWTQVFGPSLALLTPLTYSYLVIGGNTLGDGATYGFTLTATNPTGTSSAQVYFKANYPPSAGSGTVTPTSGVAITTVFEIVASGWEDLENDYPLSYYATYNSKGYSAAIGRRSLSNSISFKGAKGQYSLTVWVFDALGSKTGVALPTVSITKARRALQAANLLSAFLTDTVNQEMTYQMVTAYASEYQFDNATFTGVLTALQGYMNQLNSIDPTEVDSAISCFDAFLSQSGVMNSERLTALLDFMEKAVIARSSTALSTTQMAYLNAVLGQYAGNSSAEVWAIQRFMKGMMSDSTVDALPDQVPTMFSSPALTAYSRRVSSATIAGMRFTSGDSSVILPKDLLSSLNLQNSTVFDVQVATSITLNSTSNLFNISLFSAGRFSGYSYEVAAPTEVQVANLTTAVNFTLAVRDFKVNTTYICAYLTPSGEWSTDGVNLTTISSAQATCSATHLSTFRVMERTIIDTPVPGSPDNPADKDEEDDDSCTINFAPIALVCVIAVCGLLLTLSARIVKTPQRPPSSAENRSPKKEAESIHLYKGLDMLNDKPPTPAVINFSVVTEGPAESSPLPKPTATRMILESHVITSLLVKKCRTKKWPKVLILTVSLSCEMCVIGMFYSRDSGGNSASSGKAWGHYGPSDFKFVPAGLAVGFGVSVVLSLVFTAIDRTRAFLRRLTYGCTVFLCCALIAASFAGSVYMDSRLCYQAGAKWAISFLPLLACEVVVIQSLLAVGRMLGRKIAGEGL